jgi:hypothetical protein
VISLEDRAFAASTIVSTAATVRFGVRASLRQFGSFLFSGGSQLQIDPQNRADT